MNLNPHSFAGTSRSVGMESFQMFCCRVVHQHPIQQTQVKDGSTVHTTNSMKLIALLIDHGNAYKWMWIIIRLPVHVDTSVSRNGVIFNILCVVHNLPLQQKQAKNVSPAHSTNSLTDPPLQIDHYLCVLMNLNPHSSAGTRRSVGMESFPICGAWYISSHCNKHRWRMGLLSILPTPWWFHHC